MRLSCPNCQTAYEVPDAALKGRARTLRCDNCMTKWKVPPLEELPPEPLPEPDPEMPPEPEAYDPEPDPAPEPPVPEAEPMPEPEPEPEPEPPPVLKATRPPVATPPKPVPASKRGLQISIIIALLLIAAFLAAHRPIAHAWPPSLRLFNALGLK